MNFASARIFAAVATVALLVDYSAAFGLLDGLGLLQSYYGAMAPAAAPPPLPPPPPMPMAFPPPLPPTVSLPCAPMAMPKDCGCGCHPSCLSLLKPCLHAKLLALKKKLIEKKLTHLLSCCAQFNNHLCSHQGCC